MTRHAGSPGGPPHRDHWSDHARQWSFVRPPLRPCAEDEALVAAAIDGWRQRSGRADATAVVMGVTPELCGADIGVRGRAIAVDNSLDMIGAIWPGRVRPSDEVVCADWRHMPLAADSVDLVLFDGGLSILDYPDGYIGVGTDLGALLRRDGRCVVRCFAQIERREPLGDVLEDLAKGRVRNVPILKWRLAMALQESAEAGVAVGDVWSALQGAWPDLDRLAEHAGWPVEEVRTIEAYRGIATRYTFPTLSEYRAVFEASGFDVVDVATPGYELGERCPTVVLEPRA